MCLFHSLPRQRERKSGVCNRCPVLSFAPLCLLHIKRLQCGHFFVPHANTTVYIYNSTVVLIVYGCLFHAFHMCLVVEYIVRCSSRALRTEHNDWSSTIVQTLRANPVPYGPSRRTRAVHCRSVRRKLFRVDCPDLLFTRLHYNSSSRMLLLIAFRMYVSGLVVGAILGL